MGVQVMLDEAHVRLSAFGGPPQKLGTQDAAPLTIFMRDAIGLKVGVEVKEDLFVLLVIEGVKPPQFPLTPQIIPALVNQ